MPYKKHIGLRERLLSHFLDEYFSIEEAEEARRQ